MQEHNAPIVIGRIGGVYGVRGWMKMSSFTRPKKNIFSYSPWLMQLKNEWQETNVEAFQQRGERLLVKLAGVDSPELAREFLHCDVAVLREQLPSLSNDEHYWYDLIGLEVLNQDDISLGNITEIAETGANDVLVVADANNNKVLIPYVKGVYIEKVDLNAKFVRVYWQLDNEL